MQKHYFPGKFIVVEGLDGSGKSAQVDLLVAFLQNQGREVIVTREPTTDSEAGRTIKQVLKKELVMGPLALQQLYVQDRKEYLASKVISALERGAYIVSSRYAFSTFAYGAASGLALDVLIAMNNQFLLPDLTIIVDVSPESCMQRIESRGSDREFFEEREKLEKVADYYRKFAPMFENVVVINGEKSISAVFDEIVDIPIFKKGNQTMKNLNFAPEFESLGLSPQDQHLVAPFFTNTDDSVYGITFLPPEVIGALCSRTSRAKDDLRLVFLKEFAKPFLEGPSDYSKDLSALIDFLHQHPAEKIFANPKAREFYVTWLAQFGDDSIAQMAGAHLVFGALSQIAIKHFEDMRVGIAPIEKSTRYVDYSSRVNGNYRYYTDPTLAALGLKNEYTRVMDNLFATYATLMQEYLAFLKTKFPGEEERVLKTKSFDVLRGLLPMSTVSQVAFFANGQSFEYMINRSLDHVLGEVRWAAQRSWEELSKFIPAFLRRVESDPATVYRQYLSGKSARVREVLSRFGWSKEVGASSPAVKLLEFDADAENKIIAGLVYKETHESFDTALGRVRQLSEAQKEEILKAALHRRTQKYYKVPRAFENAFLRFEIVMNIGAWRDLHRHRMHTQERQLFTIANGFDVPEELKEAGLDARFCAAILELETLYQKLAVHSVDLAQYCTTMAHKVRFVQYQNFRAFFWEAELRTIAQGHPDYRKIEHEKIKLIEPLYPLLCKYLLADMTENYDFARRGDSAAILKKEQQLKDHFANQAK